MPSSDSKPASQFTQLRIRTNLVYLRPMKFYVPDDDESVPSAFAFGRHAISTADGDEEALLSGYFSALCAVLPDFTGIAKKIMESLGFKAEEIMVPSQAFRMKIEIPKLSDMNIQSLALAQIAFLPFQFRFDSGVAVFWDQVATDIGIKHKFSSTKLCSEADMKAISFALMLSGQSAELRSGIAPSLQALARTRTPLAHVAIAAAERNQQYANPIYAKDVNDV